jgi:hypothetical protein
MELQVIAPPVDPTAVQAALSLIDQIEAASATGRLVKWTLEQTALAYLELIPAEKGM